MEGRKIGVLVADGTDAALVDALRAAVRKAGATSAVVAPKIAGAKSSSRSVIAADHALDSGPSIFFDAVAVLVAGSGLEALRKNPKVLDWMREAYGHCKVMAIGAEALPLMKAAGLTVDDGTPALGSARDCGRFVKLASAGRHWERERD